MSKEIKIYDKYHIRFMSFGVITLLIALIFLGRLANLQIVNGEAYLNQSERTTTRKVPISAPRGEIYDRYGRPLVVNRRGFNVNLDAFLLPKDKQNDILLELLYVLGDEQLAFSDALPITLPPYEFLSDGEGETYYAGKIKKLLTAKKLPQSATAAEVMEKLIKDYKLADYNEDTQRSLAGIRYEMEQRDFSPVNPFVFALDVDMSTVIKIREREEFFRGVEIVAEATREYVTTAAAHILGRVGPIYKTESQKYIEKGYRLSDTVGKDGIERTMEDYLRGTSGIKTVVQNKVGKTIDVMTTVEPENGNNLLLTLDIDLQAAAEESLERTIKAIAARGKAGGGSKGFDASAGAVVAIDVHSGEILAMASYPTYNLQTFSADYAELLQNPDKPMINRAIAGAYAPGSTFKMVSSIAGLMSGAITPSTVIPCNGIYNYYAPSYTPACWLYRQNGGTHGSLTVTKGLQNSCNCFFYEVGRLTGIEQLNKWSRLLGLGQKTGVELTGEVAGVLAGPDYREKIAQRWNAGDTIQAAIGQSDNTFTPIQLASYVATVANGGTRYKPTLIKSISNYDNTKVENTVPKVEAELELTEQTIKSVWTGMRSVAELGTAASVFSKYEIAVAGKSGTAQVSSGSDTGVFVAFAPYEAPEIAVVVVIEHGTSGNSVAPVIKDVMTSYFASKSSVSGGFGKELTPLQ